MLSVVVTMVCFVCYCCHRNLRKRSESVYRQRWLDAEANIEIYSVAQCYDLTTDPRVVTAAAAASAASADPAHQPSSLSPSLVMIGQGPPPSYETVVAMDTAADGCDKCLQMCRSCTFVSSCPLVDAANANALANNAAVEQPIKLDADEPNNNNHNDNSADRPQPPSVQILSVAAMSGPMGCHCDHYRTTAATTSAGTEQYEFIKRCRHCGRVIDGNYCGCLPADGGWTMRHANDNANDADNADYGGGRLIAGAAATATNNNRAAGANDGRTTDGNDSDANDSAACDENCGCTTHRGNQRQQQLQQHSNNNRRRSVDLDAFNEAGLIRMDMSQIIDQSGLPTYEAALKFESSGYV